MRLHIGLIATVIVVAGLDTAAAVDNSIDQFCFDELQRCYKDCEVAEEGTEIRIQCDSACFAAEQECQKQASKEPASRIGKSGVLDPNKTFQQVPTLMRGQ